MSNENLKIWEELAHTPEEHCQSFDNRRFKGVSADPTWVKKRCTELWGPFGNKWGLRECTYGYHTVEGKTHCWIEAEFFYPGGAFPISSDVAWNNGNECRKRVHTDALKKAVSHLGGMADIYMGRFDDDEYADTVVDKAQQRFQKAEEIVAALKAAPDEEKLEEYFAAAGRRNLNRFHMDKVQLAYTERKRELMLQDAEDTF